MVIKENASDIWTIYTLIIAYNAKLRQYDKQPPDHDDAIYIYILYIYIEIILLF